MVESVSTESCEIELLDESGDSGTESDIDRESVGDTTPDMPSSSESSDVRKFLTNFRAPKQSLLTRKRAIRRNVPSTRKRKTRPSCSTDPKVPPNQRVKEFPKEHFTQSAGKLFCNACREEVSLKRSIIIKHIDSNKHKLGKEALSKREARERDIVQALNAYDRTENPSGQTLPDSHRVYRVKVVTSFLKAGVPLSKLVHFREVLEQHAYKLADIRGMYDIIPFVLEEEQKRIKSEIQGKNISIIFDGTSRLGEVLAIVVRFEDNWDVVQRLVRVQLLVKTMTGGSHRRKGRYIGSRASV